MSAPTGRREVLLVAMPWAQLDRPSLSIGLLKSVLEVAGVPVRTRSCFLEYMDYCRDQRALSPVDYDAVVTHNFLGDWIFSVPPLPPARLSQEQYYAYLRATEHPEELIETAKAFRACSARFLQACAASILSEQPAAIGFTTTFGQTIPSLALARLLKDLAPQVPIVLGGAGCEGPMGPALMRAFEWIDVVVQGEGEQAAIRVFSDAINGRPIHSSPGVLTRLGHAAVDQGKPLRFVDLNQLPNPDFSEYFAYLSSSPLASQLSDAISLPFETSRGCWWGAKSHCTFCGLNGTAMTYRTKRPDVAKGHMMELAARHRILRFNAVDNIMDHDYYRTFLPEIAQSGVNFDLFYELKANVTRPQVAVLAAAGVREVQPGLESLSTPILKLIKKGTSKLQNIRLLKWCRELGIRVHWNIIYGFPDEPIHEYDAMAALLPSLFHLQAPTMNRLAIERFSPYHNNPAATGIELLGPRGHYGYAYPCADELLSDIAYSFEYKYLDGREPDTYCTSLRKQVDAWHAAQELSATLAYSRGPDFIKIRDRRLAAAPSDFVLDRVEAEIYLSCDDGISPGRVEEKLASATGHSPVSVEAIQSFLDDLVTARLAVRDGDNYLSLACRSSTGELSQPPVFQNGLNSGPCELSA